MVVKRLTALSVCMNKKLGFNNVTRLIHCFFRRHVLTSKEQKKKSVNFSNIQIERRASKNIIFEIQSNTRIVHFERLFYSRLYASKNVFRHGSAGDKNLSQILAHCIAISRAIIHRGTITFCIRRFSSFTLEKWREEKENK